MREACSAVPLDTMLRYRICMAGPHQGWRLAACGAALLCASCQEQASGPLTVSVIGGRPALANPNLVALDAPSAFLLDATAQGLVRFDASGQIEPALAQSWIVSDDGLRYTFRLARAQWADGSPVKAEQVVERLRAATSRASRNPLKPLLGSVADIEAMTDDVLEIRLLAPRPNFLQLLAAPQMAIVRNGMGAGPLRAQPQPDGALLLTARGGEAEAEEEFDPASTAPEIMLHGEPAALAAARFAAGEADLVTGGTIGDLVIARAAEPRAAELVFDPVAGLLGLAFEAEQGLWAEVEGRRALSMALDREAIVAAFGVPGLRPRTSLLPPGIEDIGTPAVPAWSGDPLPMRRAAATAAIDQAMAAAEIDRAVVRVAMREGPGYRLLFAHLRRDWRAIGVEAIRVEEGRAADLRLIDAVEPVALASWYMLPFTCGVSPVCDEEADAALEAARIAARPAERRALLSSADALLRNAVPVIAIAAPVRWSLVSERLTGFQPNAFARRTSSGLISRR